VLRAVALQNVPTPVLSHVPSKSATNQAWITQLIYK
jgi:hypothetical protein